MKNIAAVMGMFLWMIAAWAQLKAQTGVQATPPPTPRQQAVIETSRGTIEIELLVEHAPKAVENFVKLAENAFFDGMRIHRVAKGMLIQTGDEKSKDPTKINEWGTGGKSIWGKGFQGEINAAHPLYQDGYKKGMVVTANRGPQSNTSQFMILLQDFPFWPKNYTIFGKVSRGQDVVDAIGNVDIDPVIGINDGRPAEEIIIRRVSVRAGHLTGANRMEPRPFPSGEPEAKRAGRGF